MNDKDFNKLKFKVKSWNEYSAKLKLYSIKSRVAKDNFIRKMIKEGIYL